MIVADRIAALEAEEKRALDALAILGVTPERAKSVSNGIEVLVTRFRKADMAQSNRIAALEAELAAERERREAAEKDAALYIRERDEWRQKHDFVAATARRYGVALDHIANNDDADCRLTEAQRIRLARDARRGEKD